jgi:capsid protein
MFTQKFLGDVPDVVHNSAVPYSIELMEADLCPTNVFSDGTTPRVATQVAEGNQVRQGVEKNATTGRPEAYFFWRTYPSELQTQFSPFLITPVNVSLPLDSENLLRVDARRVAHLKLTDRINQTRGISAFASVYNRLDDLKDYEESERIAARIGAAFALAITKGLDAGPGSTGGATWREMDTAPGIIADNLAPGEKIESI